VTGGGLDPGVDHGGEGERGGGGHLTMGGGEAFDEERRETGIEGMTRKVDHVEGGGATSPFEDEPGGRARIRSCGDALISSVVTEPMELSDHGREGVIATESEQFGCDDVEFVVFGVGQGGDEDAESIIRRPSSEEVESVKQVRHRPAPS
jgi:hypothetical protein